MMLEIFTVYILYSKQHDKIYIGYTSNLIQRFHAHNALATKGWTTRFRPWKVIYCEYYWDKREAMKREKYWKGSSGRRKIRKVFIQ